nr:MAG TPA: hypothetical protein [Caudoviricetes sp.]
MQIRTSKGFVGSLIALCYYWSVPLLGGNYFKYSG